MKAKETEILTVALEDAAKFAWSRAFRKDPDRPPGLSDRQHELLQKAIVDEALLHITKYFDFNDQD